MTKKYKRLSIITFWLSLLLTFLPIIIVGINGCLNGTISIENKLKLNLCFAVALFFGVLGIKNKYHCRSIVYIMLFGAYYVTKHTEYVVLMTGICCILDEFIVSPLHKYWHNKAVINHEIDKRIEV